jgi:hypothetical protein
MTDLRAAAQQALEALDAYSWEQVDAARTALRAALAQPEQEKFCDSHCTWRDHHPDCVRAEQPQRTLTDEVIANLWHANGGFHHHFARAIERWLRGHA